MYFKPMFKIVIALAAVVLLATPDMALAQQGRPEPSEPPIVEPEPTEPATVELEPEEAEIPSPDEPAAQEDDQVEEESAASDSDPVTQSNEGSDTSEDMPEPAPVLWTTNGVPNARRAVKDEPVVLAFKDVKLDELIELIALETGKVVMPIGNDTSTSRKEFNIVADQPMPRQEALDFILTYLRLNEIGIIERERVIFIGPLDEMTTQLGEIEVIPASESLADRQERGVLVFKIFQLERAAAGQIKDDISEFFPDQWAKMKEDALSNQLMVLGDIGLCQQIESIITDLDRTWLQPRIETFRLRYADAREIEANILDLFEQSGTTRTGGTSNQSRNNRTNRGGTTPANNTNVQGPTEAPMRLTVNEQQNTVTVQGEAETIDDIGILIETEWDLPRPEGTSRLFVLRHTDPIKVKDLLISVLGAGGTSSSSNTGSRTNRGGGNQQSQRTDATVGIAGVYQIEAFPDRNALLVLSKTEQSFAFIESIIERIDAPSDAGLPEIIPLKYADAVSLTEELNILLAQAGSGRASLPRPDTGLSAEGFSASGDSGGVNITGPDNSSTSQDLQFPWGNASGDQEQAPESALIGKVRIVPIVRQNALAILAPPAYQESMRKLIEAFDQPRRQVMLSATVVEVDLDDALNLGMKFGNWPGAANQGAIVNGSVGVTFTAQEFLLNLFGAQNQGPSTFNLGGFSVDVIIEALNTITNTRIIQEPRVFTADNEEAVFFSGEEFPIATGTVEAASGGLNTSTTIEYKNIGVFLNVRPRITEEGAVDLTVSVEISNVVNPNYSVGSTNTAIFGRKQVTTHTVLLDGQTVVLGGLLKETESITRNRIPLLADIPLLGALFEFNDEDLERTELIVFITPTVVHRPVDNYTNFNVQDLERLDAIARPLADQIAESEKAIDLNVHRRLSGKSSTPPTRRVTLPDRDPVQTEIDRFQPELIMLDPHEQQDQPEKP